MANAVYHRSYEPCAPIEVTITPTQLEISSLPGMDRSITDANLREFNIRSRFYRNRRIGDFLKELDLAEGRNTGIGKIVRAMRENGSPDPEFYNPETRSFMTVILPIHEAFRIGASQKVSDSTGESGKKATEKTTEKTSVRIVKLIRANPSISIGELAEKCGLTDDGVYWQLKQLKAKGIIRRIGPDKGGHWEVV